MLGLIKGLAEVVQQQHQSQKDTTQHLQRLVTTVEQLTQTLTPKVSASTQELRLPNLVLPEYTSKTDLDRFLDQIQHLLETSGVHPKFWVTPIKQQCQKDSRAYDALSECEKLHQAILGPRSYAVINFIHNHPPGTRLEGSKNPPPGTIIVYENPPLGTEQGAKSPTRDIKLENFTKLIYL